MVELVDSVLRVDLDDFQRMVLELLLLLVLSDVRLEVVFSRNVELDVELELVLFHRSED